MFWSLLRCFPCFVETLDWVGSWCWCGPLKHIYWDIYIYINLTCLASLVYSGTGLVCKYVSVMSPPLLLSFQISWRWTHTTCGIRVPTAAVVTSFPVISMTSNMRWECEHVCTQCMESCVCQQSNQSVVHSSWGGDLATEIRKEGGRRLVTPSDDRDMKYWMKKVEQAHKQAPATSGYFPLLVI